LNIVVPKKTFWSYSKTALGCFTYFHLLLCEIDEGLPRVDSLRMRVLLHKSEFQALLHASSTKSLNSAPVLNKACLSECKRRILQRLLLMGQIDTHKYKCTEEVFLFRFTFETKQRCSHWVQEHHIKMIRDWLSSVLHDKDLGSPNTRILVSFYVVSRINTILGGDSLHYDWWFWCLSIQSSN